MVSQNQNDSSSKNGLMPQKPFLHKHIPTLSPSQIVDNLYYTINFEGCEVGRYCSVEICISTTLFRSMAFNAPIALGNSCLNATFTPSLVNLVSLTLSPQPYVDTFWKICQTVKAWNYHMNSILLASWETCLNKSISIWHSR